MPFYSYICPKCREKEIIMKPVSEYKKTEYCKKCNEILEREISDLAASFRGDADFYDGAKMK